MSRALITLVLIAGLAAGEVRAVGHGCDFATLDEAKAMAERAAAHLARVGPEQALPAFMEPGGDFIDRDLYVFVIGLNGVLLASGGFPETVGSNAINARDRDGRLFIQEMLRTALAEGEGWVEYQWYNPCTRKLTPKTTFFKRVGPFVVGVGAYGTISA